MWFLPKLWAKISLSISILLFLPYIWLHYLGLLFNTLQLFKFSLQRGTHIALLFIHNRYFTEKRLLFGLKLITAFTFTAHGLYAMNIFPLPQSFIQMTIVSFGVNNDTARELLFFAGILEILLSVGIFLPKYVRTVSLTYDILWGFATAFARIYCNVYTFDFWNGLSQWHYQFLIRNAHFIIPLALFLVYTSKQLSLKRG